MLRKMQRSIGSVKAGLGKLAKVVRDNSGKVAVAGAVVLGNVANAADGDVPAAITTATTSATTIFNGIFTLVITIAVSYVGVKLFRRIR